MFETIFFATAFLLTFAGVEMFRRWSLQKHLYDVPNERSSHQTPTPRGGGVVIVCVCLVFLCVFSFASKGSVSWSYLSGAILIAVISWLDDIYSVSFIWRFLVHTLAAILIIAEFGFFKEIHLPFYGNLETGLLGAVLTILWIVWLTNAYNFMDGIDGIAGLQAFTAGIGWFFVGKIFEQETVAFYGGVLAFSALGFLIHNWQPAKIFMGDVGSAFLGYTFACLPLLSGFEKTGSSDKSIFLPLIAVTLVWLFVFDSVYTFTKRLLKKQKVWQAHREHLYQQMIIAGKSHSLVAGLYGCVSMILNTTLIFWLVTEQKYSYVFAAVFFCLTLIVVLSALLMKSVDVKRV